jgi:hypothetical protein
MSHYSLDALILQNSHSLRELQRLTGAARTTIIRHRRKLRKRYPDNHELRRTTDVDDFTDGQLVLPDVLSDVAPDGAATTSPVPFQVKTPSAISPMSASKLATPWCSSKSSGLSPPRRSMGWRNHLGM